MYGIINQLLVGSFGKQRSSRSKFHSSKRSQYYGILRIKSESSDFFHLELRLYGSNSEMQNSGALLLGNCPYKNHKTKKDVFRSRRETILIKEYKVTEN